MIDIAEHQHDGYIPLKEIAARQEISEKYLEAIVKSLVKERYLTGLRGKSGGYRLTKAPADYTAGEILRAIEGSVAPIPCLGSETNECPMWEQCFTLPFWTGLDEVINQYIDSVTLEQLSSQLPASDKKEGCCSCGTKNSLNLERNSLTFAFASAIITKTFSECL